MESGIFLREGLDNASENQKRFARRAKLSQSGATLCMESHLPCGEAGLFEPLKHAQIKAIERDDDSKKSHPALAAPPDIQPFSRRCSSAGTSGFSSSSMMVTSQPSLAQTRALAMAMIELSRRILTVSLSRSATIL